MRRRLCRICPKGTGPRRIYSGDGHRVLTPEAHRGLVGVKASGDEGDAYLTLFGAKVENVYGMLALVIY